MPISKPAGLFYLPNYIAMNTIITYLKHVREEFTHIVWPTRHTAISHTFVVIFIAIVIALLVGLLDYIFGLGVSRIILN